MKRLCYRLVALLSVILLVTTPVAAESITDSVKRESQNFDPDQAAKQVEHKAEELMAFAQSGSKLYIASALIVFLAPPRRPVFKKTGPHGVLLSFHCSSGVYHPELLAGDTRWIRSFCEVAFHRYGDGYGWWHE
jgi:hypothetical protein